MTIYVNVQKDAVYIYSTGLKRHTYKVLLTAQWPLCNIIVKCVEVMYSETVKSATES